MDLVLLKMSFQQDLNDYKVKMFFGLLVSIAQALQFKLLVTNCAGS